VPARSLEQTSGARAVSLDDRILFEAQRGEASGSTPDRSVKRVDRSHDEKRPGHSGRQKRSPIKTTIAAFTRETVG